jgi:hypothetical protein
VGLDQDDHTTPPEARLADDGPDFVSVAMGNDNPFFDFRQRGDPGGVGFTRVNTQVQLFDTQTTACSLALCAVTPAGLEFSGLPDRLGPTVLTPALSIFHTLEEGTALQLYVGKHMPIQNSGTQLISRDLQYGVALQRPISIRDDDLLHNLYVSVGALGQYSLRQDAAARNPVVWGVLPGLTYKMADNWWISGGVNLPMTPNGKSDQGQQWQVTCSLQF